MTKKTASFSSAPEIIKVDADTNQIMCNGGHPALGHPVVWYNFNKANEVECRYCDRVFVKDSKK